MITSHKLQGKNIVITGGCGDIGAAASARLCAEGARVALLDLKSRESVADEIRAKSGQKKMEYLAADVTDRASLEKAFYSLKEKWGRIDVAVANAGIVIAQPVLEITPESWKATLDVNLTGAFYTAQTVARIMRDQTPLENGIRGKILFTGSWVQDMPWPEVAAYTVSKSGIKMLAKAMAQELAELGIRVNVLAPGIVMAGLSKLIYESDPAYRKRAGEAIPLKQMQTAESVAQAFVFLCSEDSDYMTGSSLLVDGGASLVRRS